VLFCYHVSILLLLTFFSFIFLDVEVSNHSFLSCMVYNVKVLVISWVNPRQSNHPKWYYYARGLKLKSGRDSVGLGIPPNPFVVCFQRDLCPTVA
jgi:hypothetical protein